MNKLFIFFIFALSISGSTYAYEKKEISLPSGLDLIYTSYEDDNDILIIWIPSERGASSESIESILDIADEGFDVWSLDLHKSYMETPGRSSMSEFEAEDIYQLMRIAKSKGYKTLVLSAFNRGALLALNAGRLWQLNHPDDHSFPGYIFMHPHLIKGSVEIGDDAGYLPIARSVNKPVFILQPEYSTKFLRSDQVINELREGGAEVKLAVLKGAVGGFHARPKDELTEIDLAMRAQMGEYYSQGITFLLSARQPAGAAQMASDKAVEPTQNKVRSASLKPYRANPVAPELVLNELHGKKFDLADYKGKVVLINFWATWCGPCVKEIPSLNRLVHKMKGKDFQLLTVDIKEPADRIHDFFKLLKLEPDFPVLMDTVGRVSKDWKVYAYPSNFLIDKDGLIRFGYRGALEWDNPEVIKVMESLL